MEEEGREEGESEKGEEVEGGGRGGVTWSLFGSKPVTAIVPHDVFSGSNVVRKLIPRP